eukprot:TRINITY_DN360_c0_g4_i1.p1 TRINITY_DN360_c0_g4~~TRINITY_DN360_c0_g4_i1.p1  ORF type:complete len:4318 (-),score=748.48 TRINITY_DN360_c0_g4_i1:161-13114(-)
MRSLICIVAAAIAFNVHLVQASLVLDLEGSCAKLNGNASDASREGCIALVQRRATTILAANISATSRMATEAKARILRMASSDKARFRGGLRLHKVIGELAPKLAWDPWGDLVNFVNGAISWLAEVADWIASQLFGPIVDFFNKLIQGLINFDKCLPHKYRVENLIKFATDRMGNDFGTIVSDFYVEYLADPIRSGIDWIEDEVNAGFQKLQRLKNGEDTLPNKTEMKNGDWTKGLIDGMWKSLENLFNRQGYEPGRCVMTHLLQPWYVPFRDVIGLFLTFLIDPIMGGVEAMKKQVMDFVTPFVAEISESLQWLDGYLATSTAGAGASACQAVLDATSDVVAQAATDAAEGRANRTQIEELRQELNKELPITMLASSVAEGVGFLFNYVLEWANEHIIQPVLDFCASALGSGISWLLHYVNGWFGLVPFIGSALSSMLSSSMEGAMGFIQDMFVETSSAVIMSGLEGITTQFKDMVNSFLKGVVNSVQGAWGWLEPVLKTVLGWIRKAMPTMELEMKKCKKSRVDIANLLIWAEYGTSPHAGSDCSTAACSRMDRYDMLTAITRRRRRTGAPKYITRIPNCEEGKACIDVVVAGGADMLSGEYCPVAKNNGGQYVYMVDGLTKEETMFFAAETREGQPCRKGDWSFRRVAPDLDFLDPDGGYVELRGEVLACWNATVIVDATNTLHLDLGDRVFGIAADEGERFTFPKESWQGNASAKEFYLNGHFSLGPEPCTTPNITLENNIPVTERHPLMLDDPETSHVEDDYSLDPCDCFPQSWGPNPPVDSIEFETLPEGANNNFNPAEIPVAEGSASCSSRGLVEVRATSDQAECEALCAEKGCKYFFVGMAAASAACMVYSKCDELFYEASMIGTLYMAPRLESRVCMVANPEMCWKNAKRRQYLTQGGDLPSEFLAENLVRDCDYFSIIGLRVENCMRDKFKIMPTASTSWQEKKQMPKTFDNGAVVGVSCWSERYRGKTPKGGIKPDGIAIKCINSNWVNDEGEIGIGGFTCEACVQVASSGYQDLQKAGKQELYFAMSFEVNVLIDFPASDSQSCLMRDEQLTPQNQFEEKRKSMGLGTTSPPISASIEACRADKFGQSLLLERASPSSSPGLLRLRSAGETAMTGDRCFGMNEATSKPEAGFLSCASGPAAASQQFEMGSLGPMIGTIIQNDYSFDSDYAWSSALAKYRLSVNTKTNTTFWDMFTGGKYIADCGVHAAIHNQVWSPNKVGLERKSLNSFVHPWPPSQRNMVGLRELSFSIGEDRVLKSFFRCEFASSYWYSGRMARKETDYEFKAEEIKRNDKVFQKQLEKTYHDLLTPAKFPRASCPDGQILRMLYYNVSNENVSFYDKIEMSKWEESHNEEEKRDSDSSLTGDLHLSSKLTTIYQCGLLRFPGSCAEAYSTRTQRSGENNAQLSFLDGLNAKCSAGQAIQKFVWEQDISQDWMALRYTCCTIGGAAFALKRTGMATSHLDIREGVYCPTRPSASAPDYAGRLLYGKETRFGGYGSAVGKIYFDMWGGEWCIGEAASSTCLDYPAQWSDSDFKNCSEYEVLKYCNSDGSNGAGWDSAWGTLEDYATRGVSAKKACCACGGGRKATSCFSGQRSLLPQHLDFASEASDEVQPLEIVPFTDFAGMFGGNYELSRMESKDEAAFPARVHFASIAPKIPEECKAENLMDPEKMADYGITQDEEAWKENPCSLMAGIDGVWVHDWGNSYRKGPFAGGDDGNYGGISYNTMNECVEREEKRYVKVGEQNKAWMWGKLGMFAGSKFLDIPLGALPKSTISPGGVGMELQLPSIAQAVTEAGRREFDAQLLKNKKTSTVTARKEQNRDCIAFQVAFDRLFCDTYCVRQVALAGTKAVLSNLDAAARVTTTNIKNLVDYGTAVWSQKLDDLASTVTEALAASQDGTQLIAATAEDQVMALFSHLKGTSQAPLSPAGSAAAVRAAQEYTRRLEDFARRHGQSAALNGNTSSDLDMSHLMQMALAFHSKFMAATEMPHAGTMSRDAGVAVQIAEQTRLVNHEMRARNERLRDWRQIHSEMQHEHKAFMQENNLRVKISKAMVVVKFEKLVLESQYALDRYFGVVDEMNTAYTSALDALKRYEACSTSFVELNAAYQEARPKAKLSLDALRQTWKEMQLNLGLLETLVESNLFEVLAEEDASSITATHWLAAARKANVSALQGNGLACTYSSNGLQALEEVFATAASRGALAGALAKVNYFLGSMGALQSRLESEGFPVDDIHLGVITKTVNYMGESLKTATGRTSAIVQALASRLLPELCDGARSGQSLVAVAPGKDDSAEDLDALIRGANARLAAIDSDLNSLNKLVADSSPEEDQAQNGAMSFLEMSSVPVHSHSPSHSHKEVVRDATAEAPPLAVRSLHTALKRQNAMLKGRCGVRERDGAKQSTLIARSEANSTGPTIKCGAVAGPCKCEWDQMMLQKVDGKANVVTQSCCPLSTMKCGGCALFEKGTCKECDGGYTMNPDGQCVACMDVAGWLTVDHQSCEIFGGRAPSAALQKIAVQCPTGSATLKKHKGLNAKDACCSCGGGLLTATPFDYVTLPAAVGGKVYGRPKPLTAFKYSIDQECDLARYGLTFDSVTGELSGVAKADGEFSLECLVTAYQDGGLEANATMSLVVSEGISYPNPIIFGDGMPTYVEATLPEVEGAYNFELKCAPELPWLTIDSFTGTLTAREPAGSELAQGGVIGVDNSSAAIGGTCFVNVTSVSAPPRVGPVFDVVWPKYWKSVVYSPKRQTLTAGESVRALEPLEGDKSGVELKSVSFLTSPITYDLQCDAGSNDFTYDTFTGIAYVTGSEAFTFDRFTGKLGGTVSDDMFRLAQSSSTRAGVMLVREHIRLQCIVLGRGVGTSQPIVSVGSFELKIVENTCWSEGRVAAGALASSQTESVNVMDEAACRQECKKRSDCSHYKYQDPQAQKVENARLQAPCTLATASIRRRRSSAFLQEAADAMHKDTAQPPRQGSETQVSALAMMAVEDHAERRWKALNGFRRAEVLTIKGTKMRPEAQHHLALLGSRGPAVSEVSSFRGGAGRALPDASPLKLMVERIQGNSTKMNQSVAWLGEFADSLKDFLIAADRLNKMIQDFMGCMDGLPEKYHLDKVLGFTVNNIGDVSKLVNEGNKEYLQPFIKGTFEFLSSENAGGLSEATGKVEKEVAEKQRAPRANDLTIDQFFENLADRGIEMMDELVQGKGMEPTKCLYVHILKPGFLAMRPMIMKAMMSFLFPVMDMWQTMMFEMFQEVSEHLLMIIHHMPWFSKLQEVAKDTAAQNCTEELKMLSGRIMILEEQLQQPGNYPNLQKDFTNMIEQLETPIDVFGIIMDTVLRGSKEFLSWVKGSLIMPLFRNVLSIIEVALGGVLHVIDGFAGLIPEVGAMLSSGVTAAAAQGVKLVANALYEEGSDLISSMFFQFQKTIKNSIKLITGPSSDLGSMGTNPLTPLIYVIRQMASGFVPKVGERLQRCNKDRQARSRLLRLIGQSKGMVLPTPAPTAVPTPLPTPAPLPGDCRLNVGLYGDAKCPTGSQKLTEKECRETEGNWPGVLASKSTFGKNQTDKPSGCYVSSLSVINFNPNSDEALDKDSRPLCKVCPTPPPTPAPTPSPTPCVNPITHGAVTATEWVNTLPAPKLENDNKQCWDACGQKGGFCDWCGKGNACCREASGGVCDRGVNVPKDSHVCVKIASEYICPEKHVLTSLYSEWKLNYGDRRWKAGCSPFVQNAETLVGCTWSPYTTLSQDFTMPKETVRFLKGIRTYYNYYSKDRSFQFLKCMIPGAKFEAMPELPKYSALNAEFNVTMSAKTFIVGLDSKRQTTFGDKKDRGFRATSAGYCKEEITPLASAAMPKARCIGFDLKNDKPKLQAQDCFGYPGQRLFLDGEQIRLLDNISMCMDLADRGIVVASPCDIGNNQKWYFDSQKRLKSRQDGSCLSSTSKGKFVVSLDGKCLALDTGTSNVYMADCSSQSNHLWYFDGERLKTLNDERCVDYNFNTGNLYMFNCHDANNQKFYLNGSVLKSRHDGKCVDYNIHTMNVVVGNCHGGGTQQWSFEAWTTTRPCSKDVDATQQWSNVEVTPTASPTVSPTPAPTVPPTISPTLPPTLSLMAEFVTKIGEGGDWTDVHCDNGQKIIAGGCEATQDPYVFQRNSPNGETGWTCGGYGGSKKIWVLCSDTTIPVIKTKNGGDWVSVECDAGHKVIGGGCQAHGDKLYSRSAPVGDNKWECGGLGGDKKVWAICSPTIVPVMKWSEGSDWVTATCDPGYKAIGGGCSSESGSHKMSKSAPIGENAWECGGHGTHKKVVVICKVDSQDIAVE